MNADTQPEPPGDRDCVPAADRLTSALTGHLPNRPWATAEEVAAAMKHHQGNDPDL